MLILTAIAVDRSLAIMYPLKRHITFHIAYGIIAVICAIGIAVSSPILCAPNVYKEDKKLWYCVEIWTPASKTDAGEDYISQFITFFKSENFPCGPPAALLFMGIGSCKLHNQINPAIYVILNSNFHKNCRDILLFRCRRNPELNNKVN